MRLFRRSVTPGANVYVTRESVAAGDDVDAPHAKEFQIAEPSTLEQAVAAVLRSGYLPSIRGGLATWSLVSGRPLAVIAQQWPAPRWLFLTDADRERVDRRGGVLHLHFNYHTQLDPEIVLEVLRELRVHSP